MDRDEVFKEHYTKPSDFKFSSKVAGVFDDMVNRSVPYYERSNEWWPNSRPTMQLKIQKFMIWAAQQAQP